MARIFLSYTSKDKSFVRRLATSLKKLDHEVWLDEWEVRVGDSIVTKVEGAIERADFVVVVLSKNSTKSKWVETEWQSKYWDEIAKRKVMVLPVVVDNCSIPVLLRPKKYADFRSDYEIGLIAIEKSLEPPHDLSGIIRYYIDFVDIVEDWLDLFKNSACLDLLVMYSSTWRNTYLKHIRDVLAKPKGRLRVILPAINEKHPLLKVYAERLDVTTKVLSARIRDSMNEFCDLSKFGSVEIYSSTRYFNHACYLFDTGGVLAMYSYQSGRVLTPAFVLQEGELLNFLRKDFEWLVSEQNPTTRIIQTTSS